MTSEHGTGGQAVRVRFELDLPACYRVREILAFHGRDREGFAESAGPEGIRKGLVLGGVPWVLSVILNGGRAKCVALSDGQPGKDVAGLLKRAARNILALNIDPEPFGNLAQGDPLLGDLVKRNPYLRIPQTATPFEALTWAITGQQINLAFAVTLRRSLIRIAGRPHPDGIWCYPEAADVAKIDPADLMRQSFSRAKAETIVRLASLVDEGRLPLDDWQDGPAARLEEHLLAIKGIGPWTVNYALMRGFGFPDCSLHGDAAIRAAVQRLTGSANRLGAAELREILAEYAPYRSMAAAYLWASLA